MTTALLFLALGAAVVIVAAGRIGRRRVRAHGLGVLAWRWLTGEPHHGQALTDAGWSRPGTKALTEVGHVRRWWYRPRRVRAAWRTGGTGAVVLVLWGLLVARLVTLVIVALVLAAGSVVGVLAVVGRVRGWRHHRTWTAPAHLVAAPIVGLPVASDPREWLTVAPDRSRIVAILPPGWNPDATAKARLVGTLAGKLGLESPEARWSLAGPAPRLEITQSAGPPPLVTLADARKAIAAAKPDELVWGFGKRGTVVTSSLSGDSPHLGLSMGSGAGKSVTARSLAAQMLAKGAIALIIDIKWISHMWADGLPNASIVRRPAEIHEALCWLGAEVARRNEVALAGADIDGNVHATVGPRLLVVCEEMNATAAALRAYWREIRQKGDPARSPALDALDAASFMGRQVLTNLLYIGQRLSVAATGGSGDARENIGVIAFARYSASAWKMLAGDHPMPPKNLAPGRLQVVSDAVRECQGIKMSAAEARKLALSGIVSPLPWSMPGGAGATGDTVSRLAIGSAPDQGSATVSDPSPMLPVSGAVTLREAVGLGVLGSLKLAGARTARHRDESFPGPVGRDGTAELYDPLALAAWSAGRKE